MARMQRMVAGVDVGGTKIAVAIVGDDGRILARDQIPTAPERGPEAAVVRTVELVRRLTTSAAVRALDAIGLGCPGPLDSKRGVITEAPNLNSFWGYPLSEKFAQAFGVPVAMENDASAAALAEQRFGAGRGVRNLVYLTLSTGIGGGVVIEGKLYTGETGNAAEIGHSTVDRNGPVCGCGLRGCLEAFASGTALAKATGLPSGHEVIDALRRGDPNVTRIWDDAMDALSAGLGNVINIFNPKRVVLGGGLTAAGPLLFDRVRELTKKRALSAISQGVDIVPSELGADVGTLGAAAIALDAVR